MKKFLMLVIIGVFAAVSFGAFTEDFDTFSLGALVAQESWEAHGTVTVETTATSGEYIGGRALRANLSGDEWPRHDSTGVDFDLALDQDGIEYGFDMREDNTSAVSVNLFLREARTANYGPAVGLVAGKFMIRPGGTSGDTIEGNWIGNGTWEKGDWITIWIELTGTNFSTASVYCYNLTQSVSIDTGLVGIDTGVNIASKAADWTGFNLRLSQSTATYIDNAYIEDYVAPVVPEGMYSQNFDAFTLGTLVEQDSWEAHSLIDVVTTVDDGLYEAGRALQTIHHIPTRLHATLQAALISGLIPFCLTA